MNYAKGPLWAIPDAKCITQSDLYSDPVTDVHRPVQIGPGFDLMTLTVEGVSYKVNPCKGCGALICYPVDYAPSMEVRNGKG